LEVNALGGAPGVRSARFAGDGTSDADNNRFLIEKLRGVSDRSARYVCVIAVAEAGNVLRTFHGEVAGEIIDEPRGENGFGYDPYFYYEPLGLTFAQAAPAQKFQVSHRGRAVAEMLEWLRPLRAAQ
jgi:XTP/dITP diphosphohydrolase